MIVAEDNMLGFDNLVEPEEGYYLDSILRVYVLSTEILTRVPAPIATTWKAALVIKYFMVCIAYLYIQ